MVFMQKAIAAMLLLEAVTACVGNVGQPPSKLALSVNLPGPIVPELLKTHLYPLQETQVTIETEGKVWIEIRSNQRIIASELFVEKAQVAQLIDLEPGSNYTLGVFAGIFSEDPTNQDQINGTIRFASVQKINIPPDETVSTMADLVLCDTLDNLDKEKSDVCDPTFGVVIAPPDKPEVFPLPDKTGCIPNKKNDGNTLLVAGNKPDNTVIKNNLDQTIISVAGPHWIWDPFTEVFGETQLSRSFNSAHDFDTEIKSAESVPVKYLIDEDYICFNPYFENGNSTDAKVNGSNLELSWKPSDTAGNGNASLQVLVVTAETQVGQILGNADLQQAIADSTFSSPNTTTIAPPGLSFAKPTTDRFDVYLYVTNGTNWRIEGAFRYDEQWLIDMEHPAAP